jgi:hypothetical protein
MGGTALVRMGHADRCPSCGSVLREPESEDFANWISGRGDAP